jgi:cytochrome P450
MRVESIPGPHQLPFIGSTGQMARDPLRFFCSLEAKYGGLAAFTFLGEPALLVAHPDYVYEVLVEKVAIFPKAPRDIRIMGRMLGNGLLTNNGEPHRQRRRLMQPAFHTRRIQAYGKTMVDYSLAQMAHWQDGQQLDMREEMVELTMFIVSKCLFDVDRDDLANSAHQIGQAVRDLQEIADHDFVTPDFVPRWLPTRLNRKRQPARDVINTVIRRIIAERRQEAAQGMGGGQVHDRGDLLSMLLLAKDEEGAVLTDQDVRDELVTLFLAGHETTSNLLAWTWYLLSQHPAVTARLHNELDKVLGERPPRQEDMAHLPYSQMVLKESMRLYPPAWVLNTREASEKTTLGGYHVAKGTQVFISPYVMHRLPQYFPDPERFDPERFRQEQEAQLPRYVYIPFGAGPRVCIGNAFAMMEAQLILASIAQRFEVKLQAGAQVEAVPLVTLGMRDGLKVELRAR